MTMKRMLLLLVSMAALIALAAPAAAQAEQWYLEGEGPGGTDLAIGNEKNADTVSLEGPLTYLAYGGAVTAGPCDVKASFKVWNEESEGQAEIRSWGFERESELYECNIRAFGSTCYFSSLNVPSLPPWDVDVAEGELLIYGMNLRWISAACSVPNFEAMGNVHPYWNNESHCMEFESYGLKTPSEAGVRVDGELCDSSQKLAEY